MIKMEKCAIWFKMISKWHMFRKIIDINFVIHILLELMTLINL